MALDLRFSRFLLLYLAIGAEVVLGQSAKPGATTTAGAAATRGGLEAAMRDSRRAFETSRYNPAIWKRLGELHDQFEPWDQARPFNVWDQQLAWDELAAACIKNGEMRQAEAVLEQAGRKFPGVVFRKAKRMFEQRGGKIPPAT